MFTLSKLRCDEKGLQNISLYDPKYWIWI